MNIHKRNTFLIMAGMLFLVILAYSGSISRTFELQAEIDILNQKQSQSQYLERDILNLRRKLNKIEQSTKFETTTDYSQALLKALNTACSKKKVSIRDFGKQYIQKSENLISETHEICLKGDFNQLLKTVDHFENKVQLGEVTALHFDIVKQKETRENELQAKFYLRHIEKIK